MLQKKTNRLSKEKSPYLLQHAFNPVNWFSWSDEAFALATKESKPIFLSIGYSTCHWCHVMEHESFEDDNVAKLLNDNFVSIKVDREERPDIDQVYMSVCQLMNGNGGWPLSIFMTPDKKPFFAGTYFPKENRHGRIGFIDLLNNISTYWKERNVEILKSADEITKHLNHSKSHLPKQTLAESSFHKAYKYFEANYDSVYGGFGKAPKFPSPHNLMFLLRYWYKFNEQNALNMVSDTLLKMHQGGIFDHIGFGFHRYSTDQQWLVPHFEKMLYDQAMMIIICAETYLATKNDEFKTMAEKIIEYLTRDMKSPEGAFYSAEDADSEGVEGKFYVWTKSDIYNSLSKKDADLFCLVYNISEAGNYRDESTHSFNTSNIPHLKTTLDKIARDLYISTDQLKIKLQEINNILLLVREQRTRPLRDTKILTDWNGLLIAALSIAGRVFNNDSYTKTASNIHDFVKQILLDNDGALIHSFIEGEWSFNGNLDDYAFLIWGLIELYQSSFDETCILDAINLTEYTLSNFLDRELNGFFFTSSKSEVLITRTKEIYDGAIPSGNSVMMYNLIRLSRITADYKYEKYAHDALEGFSGYISEIPFGTTFSLNSLFLLSEKSTELIIATNGQNSKLKENIAQLNSLFLPFQVTILKDKSDSIFSYISNYNTIDNNTAYFICSNNQCELPTTDFSKILKRIHN